MTMPSISRVVVRDWGPYNGWQQWDHEPFPMDAVEYVLTGNGPEPAADGVVEVHYGVCPGLLFRRDSGGGLYAEGPAMSIGSASGMRMRGEDAVRYLRQHGWGTWRERVDAILGASPAWEGWLPKCSKACKFWDNWVCARTGDTETLCKPAIIRMAKMLDGKM